MWYPRSSSSAAFGASIGAGEASHVITGVRIALAILFAVTALLLCFPRWLQSRVERLAGAMLRRLGLAEEAEEPPSRPLSRKALLVVLVVSTVSQLVVVVQTWLLQGHLGRDQPPGHVRDCDDGDCRRFVAAIRRWHRHARSSDRKCTLHTRTECGPGDGLFFFLSLVNFIIVATSNHGRFCEPPRRRTWVIESQRLSRPEHRRLG